MGNWKGFRAEVEAEGELGFRGFRNMERILIYSWSWRENTTGGLRGYIAYLTATSLSCSVAKIYLLFNPFNFSFFFFFLNESTLKISILFKGSRNLKKKRSQLFYQHIYSLT